VVVEVAGRLGDVVEDLDHAIKVALAERSRGVVCDLSGVRAAREPAALEALAAAGRHVRDWPGVPLSVACPDPEVREALRSLPLGRHLLVTKSLFCAMTAVLATRTLTVERLRLSPNPTASRVSQAFVTRTLLGWRLGTVVPFAQPVICELVANASMSARTDIDLSVAWNLGALRLMVRDDDPDVAGQPFPDLDPRGPRLPAVERLSRAFGVLPTADGGKVVWAVLDAPRPL
jgi:hypothetical protein